MDADAARLLIVEDDANNRETLLEILSERGHRVEIAADGATALRLVAERPFDLMLLDISMPGMDGFEVLRRVRDKHPATQLPIIMLTGKNGREDIVAELKLGANDYVTKPPDLPVVLARMATHLSLKGAVDQIVALEHDLERKNEELQQANDGLQRANRQMKTDLHSAALVQRALLPSTMPTAPGVEFAWTYRPCDELAGDILNVFQLDDEHIGLYLLDVSGHGVRAALLSVTLSRILTPLPDQPSLVRRRDAETGRLEPTPPHSVAEELNRRFQLQFETWQYFTLFYGLLNTRTHELRFVCAGHPGPVHAAAGAAPVDLTQPIFAVGWVPEPRYEERRLLLRPGDRLYLFSDGVYEARKSRTELFGAQRLLEAVGQSRTAALDESLAHVLEIAAAWAGKPFDDDVSALAIEILPTPPV